jgi:hypothetical protein
MPMERKDVTDIWRKRLEIFCGSRNLPVVVKEKNAQMTTTAMISVYVWILRRIARDILELKLETGFISVTEELIGFTSLQ